MREGEGHSSGSTDSALLLAFLVLVFLGLVAAVVVPNLLSAKS